VCGVPREILKPSNRKQRQDGEFQASLGCIVRPSLKPKEEIYVCVFHTYGFIGILFQKEKNWNYRAHSSKSRGKGCFLQWSLLTSW
jgi:hypothetical protein